ncbi:arylamine N-acetyltransferase [Saccharopolyspora sp. K220]|uniref:arylamine N-acetyltransferase family protein n=1 Tax=Saccharopolyspora soli TaxID=2926618 RepID=UPI001F599B91|nr:arylamine N-acetyltransferase [Saccharopolyspora soli]MCI2421713.1 arylamine N-acetyltransferase [Saccharopolyspora soli]
MGEYLWGGDEVDLDAYLARIGYTGSLTPNAHTLSDLARAHIAGIPFENLDVVLGRGVSLDLPSLEAKLVHQPRGGYCFEHTTLFAAVLEQLGFSFHAYSSRVRMGTSKLHVATHAVLDVEADGGRWLVDVGFGAGALEPIPLYDGAQVRQGDWTFRLDREQALTGLTWVLRQQQGDDWIDLHAFTDNRQFPIDYRVGNFYTAEHARSPFRRQLVLQRTEPQLRRALRGTSPTLTTSRPDGAHEDQAVAPAELPDVAADLFNIRLTEEDAAALRRIATAWASAEDAVLR